MLEEVLSRKTRVEGCSEVAQGVEVHTSKEGRAEVTSQRCFCPPCEGPAASRTHRHDKSTKFQKQGNGAGEHLRLTSGSHLYLGHLQTPSPHPEIHTRFSSSDSLVWFVASHCLCSAPGTAHTLDEPGGCSWSLLFHLLNGNIYFLYLRRPP